MTYFSKKMALAEYNYEIYDKELLAIICYFEKWRFELKSTNQSVKILTDHKGLKYFITTKKLTLRQIKLVQFLSEFNFVIVYQSDKKNEKTNALTSKPRKVSTHNKNKQQYYCLYKLLSPEQIKLQLIEEKENNELILPKQVANSNWEDKTCTEICKYLASLKD